MQPDLMAMSVEAAEAARDAYDNGHHDTAVTRAYYAMFNAARAWLRHLGRPIDGKHGAIIGDFGRMVVGQGLVGPDIGRAFNRMRESRNDADYGESNFTKQEVLTMVEKAESLVDLALGELSAKTITVAQPRARSAKERAEHASKAAMASLFVRAASARGLDVPGDVEERLFSEAAQADLEDLIIALADIDDVRDAVEQRLGRPQPKT